MDAETLARRAAENESRWRTQAETWRRWHPHLTTWWAPVTDALIARADLRPGLAVLDLASGTGEPALSLAPLVLPDGTVTATDLLPEMLSLTEEQARDRGYDNVRCQVADVGNLPFADASFDRVTCRFGVMFFPDLPRALREVRRVLRPGGRAVFTAWGPEQEQVYWTSTAEVVRRHLGEVPPSPAGFNVPGTLEAALQKADMDAEEEVITLNLPFPGRPAEFLEWFRGAVAPFDQMVNRLPAERREAALDDVLATLGRHDDGRHLNLPAPVVLAVAFR
jgi:SAM-dependent methyltransferase